MKNSTFNQIQEDIRFAPANANAVQVIAYEQDPDTQVETIADIIEFNPHKAMTTRGKLKVWEKRALERMIQEIGDKKGRIVLEYLGRDEYENQVGVSSVEFNLV